MNIQRIQASGMVGWRAVGVATAAVVTGFVTHAFALGLGEPNVASVLGQPLQMTVPLVMGAGAELTQECVRIIPANQFGEPTPSLNAGRITIDAGGRQLRVESLQPIVEPTLRVVVEVGCNERIRREFALLLDPPSVVAPGLSSDVAGQPVSSLGLGMAQISAVLGQRLTLRVPVVGPDAGGLTEGCVHLADPVSGEGAPVLRQAQIRVLPHDGGSLIEVATPEPVIEPAVRLALDVGCRDPLRREYAILLGLPTLAVSNVGKTVAAAETAPSESEPKPAPKGATQARKAAPAMPAAPEPSHARAAPAQPLEAPTKAAQPATPGPDRLVLGSPQESTGSTAAGGDAGYGALDPNDELIKRLDTMSKQIEALQAQLLASRQREQELERRAQETREEWTWSMIALAALLLVGALAMAWRQRRPMPQSAWEPVVSRVPQAIAPRSVAPRAAADTPVRESSEISGRATMPPRATIPPAPSAAITEPSLSDDRNTHITVTELHDTVQVIKELYATVLERNTTGAGGGSGGSKSPRPLELDLRTPTGVGAPGGSPAPLAEPVHSDGSDRRASDERFTELPTEVGLDLDLSSVVAAAPEVVLTDLLAHSRLERAAPPAQQPPVAATAQAQAAASASHVAHSAPPAVSPAVNPARSEAASRGGPTDENLTQTPTEVLLDIDVGTTTGFPHTTDRSALRLASQRAEAERARNAPSALEPIDLQLDLSQPQVRSRQRAGRSA